ncbi:hypothetical protein [Prochlorococcus sp. MIT 1303]|uniref:hypothetical protein n=1 Tax=Prochlorococcus sp. MIT 1303 TaxID=1723647 RepID=UPI0007B33B0B|nr:hypothetical protein [Prochlorococcus sp. MIT 1303]KZR64547.1 hypothetical protein PMIT1303_01592 [Prochlorococcus sp. MIT 1303]
MESKSIAAALKNNYNSQMKITYKGSTYQELLDLTGDKGKTSFEVPASEIELIEFIYHQAMWIRMTVIGVKKSYPLTSLLGVSFHPTLGRLMKMVGVKAKIKIIGIGKK